MTNVLADKLHYLLPEPLYTSLQAFWRDFLRIKREGLVNAYQRRRLWPRILDTPPIHTDPVIRESELCVHLMCHRGDYVAAIWALKTFYHQATIPYPLVIHVQGKSTPQLEERLRTHFPNARLLLQAEADSIVESLLLRRNLMNLLRMRKLLPIMQKFTDVIAAAESRHVLILDSDVLFFEAPLELMEIDLGSRHHGLFQRDYTHAYVLSSERALADLKIDLQPQINTGIVVLSPALVDLERCEEYLRHPDFARPNGHMEQTLFALEASRNRVVSYLPAAYFVGPREPAECNKLKARHYAGPSRALLAREGMAYLVKTGFLRACGTTRPGG